MVDLAQILQGWTRSVYKFGCAFIHLSSLHDYNERDPLSQLPAEEKEITSLRQSLGEPLPGAALAFAKEFSRRLSDTVKPWTGGQVALAREIIAQAEPNKPPKIDSPKRRAFWR
jgi:hypothetical protein